MVKRLIKICGILDVDTAIKTAELGANFIGLVFHLASPRYVSVKRAIDIAMALKQSNTELVGVFTDHTAKEIQTICEVTQMTTVQLHGVLARSQMQLLPQYYKKFYVSSDTDVPLNPSKDFILIDHESPGCGNHVALENTPDFPWFLAGGLTSNNVPSAIQQNNPTGVDVSSGVESSRGKKDITLIQEFISAVRGCDET